MVSFFWCQEQVNNAFLLQSKQESTTWSEPASEQSGFVDASLEAPKSPREFSLSTSYLQLFSRKLRKVNTFSTFLLKVAFSQKGLMRLSFPQADKPNYFPELEFWTSFHSKWLKSFQIRTWGWSECSKTAFEQLQVLIWHDLSYLDWKEIQNSSSGK